MIHSTAEVQTDKIGKNTLVWQFVVILKDAVIGDNCNINCHTFIENDVVVGNNVTIKSGIYLWDGLRIEDDVHLGPNVTFINDRYPRSKQYEKEFEKTIIKRGASIAAGSTVMCGITIGEFAMIGAASFVNKNVPAHQLWYGSPAVHKGFVTKSGIVLNMDLQDTKSGRQYILKNGEPV